MSIFPGAEFLFEKMIENTYHETKTDKERFKIAEDVLLGRYTPKGGWKKRGRKAIDDRELLYKMGSLVNEGHSANAASKICAASLKENYNPDSTSERLRKKFRKNKKLYMAPPKEKTKEETEFSKEVLKMIEDEPIENRKKVVEAFRNIGWPV